MTALTDILDHADNQRFTHETVGKVLRSHRHELRQWTPLTKREQFAAQALAAMITTAAGQNTTMREMAACAVEAADALIKALEK